MPNPKTPNPGRKLFYGLFIFPLLILAGMIILVTSAIVMTHEKETPESLMAAIKSGSERKRWQAASELANELNISSENFRDKTILAEMIDIFRDKSRYDTKTRAYLAMALSRFPEKASEDALREALRSGEPDVQFYALWALGKMGTQSAAGDILPLLNSEREDIRVSAVYILGALEVRSAAGDIRNLLKDPSDDVRWNAALALARLQDPEGLPVLMEMLDRNALSRHKKMGRDEVERIMVNAVKGLALIPRPESIKILENLSRNDESLKVRQAAMDAMNKIKQHL